MRLPLSARLAEALTICMGELSREIPLRNSDHDVLAGREPRRLPGMIYDIVHHRVEAGTIQAVSSETSARINISPMRMQRVQKNCRSFPGCFRKCLI